jgi:hypothetical protein
MKVISIIPVLQTVSEPELLLGQAASSQPTNNIYVGFDVFMSFTICLVYWVERVLSSDVTYLQ